MAKDLEEALTNIETKLGGEPKPELKDLGDHLEYIESLIGGGGGEEVPTFEASTFDFNPPVGTFNLTLAEEDINDIIENAYTLIKISYDNNGVVIIWPFVLSASQASTSVIYTSVASAINVRFLLDFVLQAGQILTASSAMINTSNIADIKVDNTSVVDQTGSVNLATKTAYDASTNKLATEADLGGGGSVYMHMIYFNSGKQKCTVYSTSSTPYTFTSFDTFLKTVGRYETYPAYGQYTDGGLKYQIVSVEDANNTPARLDFRCIMINPTTNVVSFSSISCFSNAFTKDIVIEM